MIGRFGFNYIFVLYEDFCLSPLFLPLASCGPSPPEAYFFRVIVAPSHSPPGERNFSSFPQQRRFSFRCLLNCVLTCIVELRAWFPSILWATPASLRSPALIQPRFSLDRFSKTSPVDRNPSPLPVTEH